MKYIIGASIGGLFGFSLPMMLDVEKVINSEVPRIENSQPVDDNSPVPIKDKLILPDNTCGYLSYDSKDTKEKAKECLNYDLPAMPAI